MGRHMSVKLNAIKMGVRMGLIVGDFDKQADEVDHVDGLSVSERTNGGILVFFLVLLISASISTYGIWELVRYLIHHY